MKNIEVFKNLNEETYEKLGKILRRRELNKKEVLFLEREVVERVYFIEEGKISLFKITESGERKIIFILRNGQMINDVLIDKNKTTTDFLSLLPNQELKLKNIFGYIWYIYKYGETEKYTQIENESWKIS